MSGVPLLFERVKLLAWDTRPEHWLRDGVPVARIVLMEGPFGESGGILHVLPTAWLVLSKEQVFDRAPIVWFSGRGVIRSIVIDGQAVIPTLG